MSSACSPFYACSASLRRYSSNGAGVVKAHRRRCIEQVDRRVKVKLLRLGWRRNMNHEAMRNDVQRGAHRARVRCLWLQVVSVLLLIFSLPFAGADAFAQKRKTAAPAATKEKKKNAQTTAAEQLAATRDEFVKKTNEYKKSLAELLTFYEKDVKQAEDKRAKLQELYAAGLLAKRDLDANAKEIEDAKAKVAETQKQMQTADDQIAETLVEEKTIEQAAQAPPPRPGKLIQTSAYIRYKGH